MKKEKNGREREDIWKKNYKWCGGGLYSKEQFFRVSTCVIKEELVKIESACPDIVVQRS